MEMFGLWEKQTDKRMKNVREWCSNNGNKSLKIFTLDARTLIHNAGYSYVGKGRKRCTKISINPAGGGNNESPSIFLLVVFNSLVILAVWLKYTDEWLFKKPATFYEKIASYLSIGSTMRVWCVTKLPRENIHWQVKLLI